MTVTHRSIAVLGLCLAGLAPAVTDAHAAAADAELTNIPERHGIALWSQHHLASSLIERMVSKRQGKGGAQLRFELNRTNDQRSKLEDLLAKAFASAEKERTGSPERFFERLETVLQEGLPGILTKPQMARFEELFLPD